MSTTNESIKCTIKQCQNHAANDDYCMLNQITVGTDVLNPTTMESTDCRSFRLRK